jgi:hypothetical protein
MSLIKRLIKGFPLTWEEMDDNLQYLEDLINNIPTGSNNLFEGEIDFLLFSPDFNSISNWEETFVKPISVLSGGALTGLQCKGILVEGSAIEDSGDYGYTSGSDIEIKTFVFQGAADVGPFEGTTDIWVKLTITIQSFIDKDDISGYGTNSLVAQLYSFSTDESDLNYIFDLTPAGFGEDVHNIRATDKVNFQDYFNDTVTIIDNTGNFTSIQPSTINVIDKVINKVFYVSLESVGVQDGGGTNPELIIFINDFDMEEDLSQDWSANFEIDATDTPDYVVVKDSNSRYKIVIDITDLTPSSSQLITVRYNSTLLSNDFTSYQILVETNSNADDLTNYEWINSIVEPQINSLLLKNKYYVGTSSQNTGVFRLTEYGYSPIISDNTMPLINIYNIPRQLNSDELFETKNKIINNDGDIFDDKITVRYQYQIL